MYTWKGKVVYERKRRNFDWNAARRIVKSVTTEGFRKEEDIAKFLEYFRQDRDILHRAISEGQRNIERSDTLPRALIQVTHACAEDLIWVPMNSPIVVQQFAAENIYPGLRKQLRILINRWGVKES